MADKEVFPGSFKEEMSLVDKGKLRNEFLLSFDPAGTKKG